MDSNLRKTIRTEVNALQTEVGITSLYVTHNQEEAMTMADRIAIMNDGELQQIGAPEVVFNRPANTFVATFIESPNINLFAGTLEATGDGYHVSNAAFGLNVAAAELPPDLESQSVQLGARPQDLRPVTDANEADVAVTGTVGLIEPLGTDAIVRVQTDEGPVTAMVDGYERLDHGDELTLGIDVDEIYLFDAAGDLLKPRHYEAATTDEVTA